jgi:predicted amidohydrolase
MGETKMKVATTNIRVEFDKEKNVKMMGDMTQEAARNGAKLIVFAEQAVQGYFNNLVGPLTTGIIRYHQKNAEVIPEGESTQKMIQAARENGF